MIQTNAKCVVNGKKVNEIAGWVNQFIKLTNEEIDIVDTGNTPGKRWFLTGKLAGGLGAGSAEDGDRNNLGGTGGSALGAGGGGGNLDKLNMAAAAPLNQGGAAMPPNIVAAAMPPMKPPAGGAGGGSANMISIGGRQVRQQPTTEATEATTPAPPVALTPDAPTPPSAPTPPPTSATSTDTPAEQPQVSSPVNTNTDTARVANEIQSEERRLEQEIQRLVARRDGIKSQLKLNANVWSYETNLKYMNEMRELDKEIKELQA
jgi:hypothetical protein